MLGNNNSGSSGTHSRRSVLKGIGALGAAAVAGTSMSGSAAAQIGDSAVYQYYHTDWTQITDNLAAVADAGYDAIQVPPAQFSRLYEYERQSDSLTYSQPLGYQPIDFTNFDSVFGTEEEYAAMVEEAHNQGLDVIADAVINHMAAGGDYFDRKVTLDDIPQFSSQDFHPSCSIDYSDPESVEDCWLVGLRDLDQDSSYVRTQLRNYVEKYANLGVDGIRFDAVKHVPESFFSQYANQWTDELGLYTVGEVLDGSTAVNQGYADTGMSVTDYALYFVMKEQVFKSGGDMNALDGAGLVNQDPTRALTFVSNHDSAPPEYERLAYAYILTYEGYPRVYNHRRGAGDSDISNLLWIRRNVLSGAATTRYVDNDLYIFERGDGVVAINIGSGSRSQQVQTNFGANTDVSDCTGTVSNTTTNGDGSLDVSVPAQEYVVYSTACVGDGGGSDGGSDDGSSGGDDTTGLTLKMEAPTASGESVYFTGSTSSLTNWGSGVEGTENNGVWQVTIEDPGSSFEWKTRRGPSGSAGEVWEAGSNHTSSNLTPSHNGWEDGFEGTSGSAVFSVANLGYPSSATTGDVITVSADVTNSGDADGTKTVDFVVDGTVVQSTDVSLSVDATTAVSFDYDTTGTEANTVSIEVATPDDSQSATVDISSGGTTLRISAPTADGESVYFTGSTSSLTNWSTGIEGTLVDGAWEVTIQETGSFEWKTRRGPSGDAGDVWEAGDNHTSDTLSPSHNGWEDGFTGSTSTSTTETTVQDGATYVIRNKNSGKALDVYAASQDNGADVIQWDVNGGSNQRWTAEATGDGYYRLTPTHSGKALDVSGGPNATQDGANVHQWDYLGNTNQQWAIEETSDGVRLVARHSGKVLEVASAGTNNGDTVQQNSDSGGAHQRWTLEQV
ncbi:DUF1939 domain-containing protein [Halapricum sp. CBA1109]|uniref:alpha-amylase domain-containing protein n=1 Tax=Halapricum sp. CBA1109 TaxID=2668068 RepID=UPI0012FA3C0C|nr:alpha-amylase domain-containing protein [Halapricum sp. CBA1109]MUV88865.1 DUF1939 domain-containing protein [Halapricum sp. CBA1109]